MRTQRLTQPALSLALALVLTGLVITSRAAPATDTGAVPVAWNALAAAPDALTVTVAEPGVVTIAAAALAAGGWDLTQVTASDVRVWHRGVEVPAHVTADANGWLTGVQFVASANESPFSRETVYWLTPNASQGQAPAQRLPGPPAGSLPFAWEADQVYEPALASWRVDSWFAAELRSGADPQAIALTLPEPLSVGGRVQLAIAPATRRAGHALELWHRDQRIGVVRWDDGAVASPRTITIVAERPLPAGDVTLEVALISQGADRVMLDALTFPDTLLPLPTLTPTPVPVTPRDLRAGPASGQAGADYLIITHASLRDALPPLVALKQAQGDLAQVIDVQWAYDAFSFGERDPAALRALIAVAAAHWSPAPRAVLLVGAGTVRMRGGEARAPTPGLVLSDAPVADPLIPPFLVRGIDPSGEVACDTCYTRLDAADVRADLLPNLPIGRIPARSLDEARTVIGKIVGHAAPPPGSWRGRALFLADNDAQADGMADPAGPFTSVIRDAVAMLPPGVQAQAQTFAYAPQPDAPGGTFADTGVLRCRLFRAWDGGSPADAACPPLAPGAEPGASLLVYVGHGSPWQWAATSPNAATPYLLYLYDADGRRNGQRLPIVLSMTCLSGNWANPILQALDERMLVMPGGGSVAAFAAAGSGVNTGHAALLAGLLPVLTAEAGPRTLGDAHLSALAQLGSTHRDLAYSFHILGDPDTRLPPLPRYATYLPVVHQ